MRPLRYMADVSSNNGRISVSHYSNAGHAVIAIKATEGTGYQNPFHVFQCEEAHRLGLTVVHYHFCRPGEKSIDGEIHNFRSTYLRGWRKGDYACFDLEENEGSNVKGYAESILQTFEHLTGHPPILYTYVSFAEEHLKGLRFRSKRWWMAKYSSGTPTLPKGQILWAWQFTDGSNGPQPHFIPGIGNCDVSLVNRGVAMRLWIRKLRRRKK